VGGKGGGRPLHLDLEKGGIKKPKLIIRCRHPTEGGGGEGEKKRKRNITDSKREKKWEGSDLVSRTTFVQEIEKRIL